MEGIEIMRNQNRLSNISSLLRKEFGIVGSVIPVAGENENYLITADDGRRFVLKIAECDNALAMIELENMAVEAAAAYCPDLSLPRLVKTCNGKIAVSLHTDKKPALLQARLLRCVEGTGWFEDQRISVERCRDLGRRVAQLDLALSAL